MSKCQLYVGLHQPSDARHFERAFISVNRLRERKSGFEVGRWIMDSGAFTEIATHGRYRESVVWYAQQIERWKSCGTLEAAVAQDYMCEPHIRLKTGLSVSEHQKLTLERYDTLQSFTQVYVLPVLQGYAPEDYVRHLALYGDRLKKGQWVGVGSICKRNADPEAIYQVLSAIKQERPDLRLHGFGLKKTALADAWVHELLHTTDSMSWSFAERKKAHEQRMAGLEVTANANDYRAAQAFEAQINSQQRVKYGRQRELQLA